MALDGAKDDAERDRLLRPGPDREADPAARAEDAVRLGQRLVRAPEVQEPEAHDDRVEARVGEGERLGVARLEVDRGVVPAGLGQHRRREVDPHDRGAAPGGRGRDVARPCRDVEHANARAHARGVQERPDRLGRQRAEGVLVRPGDALPPGPLEGVKRRGVSGLGRSSLCAAGDDLERRAEVDVRPEAVPHGAVALARELDRPLDAVGGHVAPSPRSGAPPAST